MQPDLFQAIANMAGDMTANMVVSMRNVLHLALSISPLLLLIPKKFNMVGIRRDHLITVSVLFLSGGIVSAIYVACSLVGQRQANATAGG